MSKLPKKKRVFICPKCGSRNGVKGSCPYDSDVNAKDTICNCCPDCRHECLMDI